MSGIAQYKQCWSQLMLKLNRLYVLTIGILYQYQLENLDKEVLCLLVHELPHKNNDNYIYIFV